jgi:hypothetical protein
MDADKGEVVATAKGNMLTSLLKAVGIRDIGFGSSATVRKGRGTVEVALVLDNSGSMAGQPIGDLVVAAKNVTSVLYAGYEGSDKVKVGIVPFAGSVNVGVANQGAAWVDRGGLSPVHAENFPEPSGSRTMPTRAPCWRAAPRVRRKPMRRATEPPWRRPSRRLRAKSRNCDSPVETRQGRRLFRRRSFVHV